MFFIISQNTLKVNICLCLFPIASLAYLCHNSGMKELIRKSAAAAIMIAIGDFVLLKIGAPLGAFLFAFGLLGVCALKANLFTGKAGAMKKSGLSPKDMLIILATNLIVGYLIGAAMSYCDSSIKQAAVDKVAGWDISLSFLIRAFFCGVIMYISVQGYKKTPLSVLIGVPVFILCGFQHCIANIITLGIANTWHWSIILAIAGNWLGSYTIAWLLPEDKKTKVKLKRKA